MLKITRLIVSQFTYFRLDIVFRVQLNRNYFLLSRFALIALINLFTVGQMGCLSLSNHLKDLRSIYFFINFPSSSSDSFKGLLRRNIEYFLKKHRYEK